MIENLTAKLKERTRQTLIIPVILKEKDWYFVTYLYLFFNGGVTSLKFWCGLKTPAPQSRLKLQASGLQLY